MKGFSIELEEYIEPNPGMYNPRPKQYTLEYTLASPIKSDIRIQLFSGSVAGSDIISFSKASIGNGRYTVSGLGHVFEYSGNKHLCNVMRELLKLVIQECYNEQTSVNIIRARVKHHYGWIELVARKKNK